MKTRSSQSNDRYRNLFDNMLEGFAHCKMLFDANGHPIDWIYLCVNKAFEPLTGLKNITGKKVTTAIPGIKNSNPELFKIYSRVALKGKPESFEDYIVPLSIWLHISVFSPIKGEFVALFQNITNRKKAEEEIKKYSENLEELVKERTKRLETINKELLLSENKYRDLFESNRDGIIFGDIEGNILNTNKSFRDMIGYTTDELKKLSYQKLTPKKWAKIDNDHINMVIKKGYSDEYEKELIRKDGSVLPISLRVWIVKDKQGNKIGLWGIARDITDINKLQEELIKKEKLTILGQLAGGLAHDLRNPLGAIKNSSYFLNMAIEKPQPEVKKALGILNKAVTGSEDIISSILSFTSPRSPIKKKVNIRIILQDIISQTTVPDNIKVLNKLDKAMPAVLADPGQAEQIFLNIILNAIQSMPEGGELTLKSAITGKQWLDISISDTGSGIPEENMNKIFDPLFTTKAKGIGLGLAVLKILVDNHGGKTSVKSKVGKGSTFTVALPIKIKK